MTPPAVGPTGSKVVSYEIEMRRNIQTMHYGPPIPPTREDPVFDEDGDVTDYVPVAPEEFERRKAAFEKACDRWNRTHGTAQVQAGPDTFTCRVTCEDGTTAKALGDDEWHWMSWETPVEAPPNL